MSPGNGTSLDIACDLSEDRPGVEPLPNIPIEHEDVAAPLYSCITELASYRERTAEETPNDVLEDLGKQFKIPLKLDASILSHQPSPVRSSARIGAGSNSSSCRANSTIVIQVPRYAQKPVGSSHNMERRSSSDPCMVRLTHKVPSCQSFSEGDQDDLDKEDSEWDETVRPHFLNDLHDSGAMSQDIRIQRPNPAVPKEINRSQLMGGEQSVETLSPMLYPDQLAFDTGICSDSVMSSTLYSTNCIQNGDNEVTNDTHASNHIQRNSPLYKQLLYQRKLSVSPHTYSTSREPIPRRCSRIGTSMFAAQVPRHPSRVRGNRITASRDHWVVDSETAAVFNFQNREDQESDDEQQHVDKTSDQSSQKSNDGQEFDPYWDRLHDSDKFARRSSINSLCGNHMQPAYPFVSRDSRRRRATTGATLQKLGTPAIENGSVVSASYSTVTEDPQQSNASSLWKHLADTLRRRGLPAANASSYLSQLASQNPNKQMLLHTLLMEQKSQGSKYIQWSPSVALAMSSAAETDVVEAVRVISALLVLRDQFIHDYGQIPSMCIFPPTAQRPPGEGSNEPIFDVSRVRPLPPCDAEYRMEDGVFQVYWNPTSDVHIPTHFDEERGGGPIPWYKGKPLLTWKNPVPTVGQFLSALKDLMNATQHPACKSFAFRRLAYLRNRFAMHLMFNTAAELQETKENTHRDFYNVRKVDTHVHHSACMHQKHLLRFIRKKYRTEPDQTVARSRDGTPVTLRQIFDAEVGITAWEASVDLLNVHALGSCFHRFDIFNSKYNPFGQALLREVFLKTDNMIQGRYLAEITKEVVEDLEDGKYQFVEWRISVYGKTRDEWKKIGKWIHSNGLNSKQVRWMVQVPRLYHVYRKLNLIKNFADLLSNIFGPLFEAVRDPEAHPDIFHVLLQMNGWDSVDDESVVSKYTSEGGALPLPEQWTEATNPPYSYWAYYMYANIRSLNELLVHRGLRQLPFRPHCGEAGSISHLASMYLLADGINHGIMLRKTPLLQYLYYLRQVGLAVSPLSNNALFHPITKNPFYDYFSIGLNVSLSSDDPLMFHFTDEPLLEEYSCCAHVWKLSPVDLCEIARNSVLQSHFEPQLKKHWLGENYELKGKRGNDIRRTNVSDIRVQYRHDTLMEELQYIRDVLRIDQILDQVILTV